MASHSHSSISSTSSSSGLDRRDVSHEKEQPQKREEVNVHHDERRDPREKEKERGKDEKKETGKEAEIIKDLRANLK